jgi:hypothetical protein
MGTKDLHKEFIKRPQHEMKNKKAQNNLSELGGGVVGVDVSLLMYGIRLLLVFLIVNQRCLFIRHSKTLSQHYLY